MGEDEHDAGASTHGANHPSVSLRLVTPDGERLCAGEDFNLHRWPPVPCAKYFDDRAWTAVESFAARVVRGEACVSSLARDDDLEPAGVCPGRGVNQDGTRIETLPMYTKGQRKRRTNLRVHLAYYGPAFTGWAWTPQHDEAYTSDETVQWAAGERSVTASIQRALKPLLMDDKERPICSAGRTDRGVSGAAQCFSVWSNSSHFTGADVDAALGNHPAGATGAWRVVSPVEQVSTAFHATFCATWRRYVYVLPMRALDTEDGAPADAPVDVERTNTMLDALRGKTTDMSAFARATPPGKDTRCAIKVARAFESSIPAADGGERGGRARRNKKGGSESDRASGEPGVVGGGGKEEKVLVIELVADRFLRKMVRVLVATAVREAATGAGTDVLLRLAAAGERAATAPPAPPEGLIFAGVGYGNHPRWDDRVEG